MREIKFRAKTKHGDIWRVGDIENLAFLNHPTIDVEPIISFWNDDDPEDPEGWDSDFVYPDTIGQYIGLKDKNGKEIFEGDIVRMLIDPDFGFGRVGKVTFSENTFGFICEIDDTCHFYITESHRDIEVIGNIFDNPDLKLEDFEYDEE